MAKRIIVALIFVPVILCSVMWLPTVVWGAGMAFISAMAAFELLRATGEGKITSLMRMLTVISAALIPVGAWAGIGVTVAFVCIFILMVVSFWCAIRRYEESGAVIGFYHVLLTVFGGGVIPLCLSTLVVMQGMEHGRYMVIFTVILNFITDGGAYFGGVFLGKHRGITKVSPNKSLEGYISGVLTGVVFAVLYGLFVSAMNQCEVNLVLLAVCGLLGAVVTALGDLVFSFIKREYGVKDYGHLLPGHGGMLDRFDSMVFCGPVVLFILMYLPVF